MRATETRDIKTASDFTAALRNLVRTARPLAGLLLLLTFLVQRTLHAETLRLATGSPDGVYDDLGHGLKQALEADISGLTVEIVNTSGSVANATLLGAGADLAFVQNDIAYYAYHGVKDFQGKVHTR